MLEPCAEEFCVALSTGHDGRCVVHAKYFRLRPRELARHERTVHFTERRREFPPCPWDRPLWYERD